MCERNREKGDIIKVCRLYAIKIKAKFIKSLNGTFTNLTTTNFTSVDSKFTDVNVSRNLVVPVKDITVQTPQVGNVFYDSSTGSLAFGGPNQYSQLWPSPTSSFPIPGNYKQANTGFGQNVLQKNTEGFRNTGYGFDALANNTTGAGNTAVGIFSSLNNTTGGDNSSLGAASLFSNTTGFGNVAVGVNSLHDNTTGTENTMVGANAPFTSSNVSGNQNTALGFGAGPTVGNLSNTLCLGANATAAVSNTIHLSALTTGSAPTANFPLSIDAAPTLVQPGAAIAPDSYLFVILNGQTYKIHATLVL